MLRVGLDIDNTITRNPEFFRFLTHPLRDKGGETHIVSSRTDSEEVRRQTEKELKSLGIVYDRMFLLPNQAVADAVCPHSDLDWYQRCAWQKVDYCPSHGILIFFDDEEKVARLFQRFAPGIQVVLWV